MLHLLEIHLFNAGLIPHADVADVCVFLGTANEGQLLSIVLFLTSHGLHLDTDILGNNGLIACLQASGLVNLNLGVVIGILNTNGISGLQNLNIPDLINL